MAIRHALVVINRILLKLKIRLICIRETKSLASIVKVIVKLKEDLCEKSVRISSSNFRDPYTLLQ